MSEHVSSRRRGRPSRELLYQRVREQIAELWDRLGGLPTPAEAQDIWRELWYDEAHLSTAIEGNTLVLKQVEALLELGRAVGNKELAEYIEVKGYADAADWVYHQTSGPAMAADRQIVAIPGRLASYLHDRCSTTCIASWSRQWRGRRGSFRWLHWRTTRSRLQPCARRRIGAGFKPPVVNTANGAAQETGSTTTSPADIAEAERTPLLLR